MSDCWIVTRSGIHFDLLEPTPDMVCIEDIAWALANIIRFTGHTNWPYSVAQHSVLGAKQTEGRTRLEFLLHDAHEAYVGDLSGPMKPLCPSYRNIESRINRVVRIRFGLPFLLSPQVKEIDLRMLATEKRDLMPQAEGDWPCLQGHLPYRERIIPCATEYVRDVYRNMLEEELLKRARG